MKLLTELEVKDLKERAVQDFVDYCDEYLDQSTTALDALVTYKYYLAARED